MIEQFLLVPQFVEREKYQGVKSKFERNERKEGRKLGVDPLKRKRNGGKPWRGCNSSRGNKSAQIKASERREENEKKKKTKLRSGEIKNFAVVVQTRHNQPSAFTSSNVSKEHCSLGETITSSLLDQINNIRAFDKRRWPIFDI